MFKTNKVNFGRDYYRTLQQESRDKMKMQYPTMFVQRRLTDEEKKKKNK